MISLKHFSVALSLTISYECFIFQWQQQSTNVLRKTFSVGPLYFRDNFYALKDIFFEILMHSSTNICTSIQWYHNLKRYNNTWVRYNSEPPSWCQWLDELNLQISFGFVVLTHARKFKQINGFINMKICDSTEVKFLCDQNHKL